MNDLKCAISAALGATKKRPLLQAGFFDDLLRNDKSDIQKLEHVRENPVGVGLVTRADRWPYQTECVFIDRA